MTKNKQQGKQSAAMSENLRTQKISRHKLERKANFLIRELHSGIGIKTKGNTLR